MNQFTGLNRKRGLSRRDGGTGETAKGAPEVLGKLDVPSLSGTNSFTGANEFTQDVVMSRAYTSVVVTDQDLVLITTDTVTMECGGTGVGAIFDLTGMAADRTFAFPDASGTLLLDAPSDGKYYVRKDGAWVEIIP